jgi:predicted tellurium resistance membrane protein TerC
LAFAVVAFVGLALLGHDLVAFEVTVLMINWSVLITSGVLLSVVFRRARQSTRLPRGNQTAARQAEAVK